MREIANGEKLGNLLVIKEVERHYSPSGASRRMYLCRCDCGNEIKTSQAHLLKGKDIMCRTCSSKKSIKAAQKASRKHGESYGSGHMTRLYGVWSAMKRRCQNPNACYYSAYGGRGIKVCSDWQEYIPFRDWALSSGYEEGLTLDRINVNGDYCPENCRWVDMKTQQNNRRNNIVEYGMSMEALSEKTGIKVSTLYERRRKNKGISLEKLTESADVCKMRFDGKTIPEIEKLTGIDRRLLYARLERNPKITFEELTKGVEICKIKVFGKTLPELAKETGLKYMTLRRRLERNPDITLEELIRPVEKHIRS